MCDIAFFIEGLKSYSLNRGYMRIPALHTKLQFRREDLTLLGCISKHLLTTQVLIE